MISRPRHVCTEIICRPSDEKIVALAEEFLKQCDAQQCDAQQCDVVSGPVFTPVFVQPTPSTATPMPDRRSAAN